MFFTLFFSIEKRNSELSQMQLIKPKQLTYVILILLLLITKIHNFVFFPDFIQFNCFFPLTTRLIRLKRRPVSSINSLSKKHYLRSDSFTKIRSFAFFTFHPILLLLSACHSTNLIVTTNENQFQ